MAVTISKTKVKPAPVKALEPVEAVEPTKLSDEGIADLYGALLDKVEALKLNPLFTQLEVAEKELKQRLLKFGNDETVTITGEHWIVEAGVCGKSPRKILDLPAVAKFVGQEAFLKIAKVGVGDAEKYLTPEQLAKVVSDETYTTNRKIATKFLG